MTTFMNLPKFEEAKVAILPVPYEKTTSYKKGTKNAPERILFRALRVALEVSPAEPNIFCAHMVQQLRMHEFIIEVKPAPEEFHALPVILVKHIIAETVVSDRIHVFIIIYE